MEMIETLEMVKARLEFLQADWTDADEALWDQFYDGAEVPSDVLAIVIDFLRAKYA